MSRYLECSKLFFKILSKIIKAVVPGIMLLMILGGCALFPREEKVLAPPLVKPVKVQYEVFEVKKQTLKKELRGGGSFIYSKRYQLFYKYSGSRLKSVYVRSGDKVKKGAVIAEIENESILENIKQTETEVKKANLRLKLAQLDMLGKSEDFSVPKIEQEKAKINLELLKLDLGLLEDRLEKLKRDYERTHLISPIDGDITYVCDAKEGDPVQPYSTIVEVADPSKLELDWQVTDSSNRSNLNIGMEVDVKIKDVLYKGKIIATPADFPLEEREKYQSTIRIEVSELPASVEAGDNADITATLEKRDNVIVIPRNAVRMELGRNYVLILDGSVKRERDVELGLTTPTDVEVIKGLEEGQKVILR